MIQGTVSEAERDGTADCFSDVFFGSRNGLRGLVSQHQPAEQGAG
jgi:hypothetical protein